MGSGQGHTLSTPAATADRTRDCVMPAEKGSSGEGGLLLVGIPLYAKELIAGGVAGGIAKTAVAPLERIKILFQTRRGEFQSLGVWRSLGRIFRTEGVLGLYRGNGASVARIVPYAALHYMTYEEYRRWILDHYAGFGTGSMVDLVAGSFAGGTAVLCTYPLDLVRTMLAYQVTGSYTTELDNGARRVRIQPAYRGILDVFAKVYREGGLRGLYRGVGPSLYGIFPYAGLKFYVYEELKRRVPKKHEHSMTANLACGSLAGLVGQTFTYPLDVVRRQMQLSRCFLICMKDDSIEGIYDTLKECAVISKSAGGIGVSMHNIRSTNSYIRGTNGTSNGIVPMLRVFNDTARYVDQGGGKRKGAFAVYLEPWHADIFDFLDLRKNHGKEENRARDLFYGLWIPDLFMKRVQDNATWSLFCPNESPGLADCWGEEFDKLYLEYEQQGKARKVVQAQKLWFAILESQIETGNPYMLYKDSCNRKSNQQNLGTIKSSNLCTEIIEYTSPTESAVCNLASLALPRFVREKGVPIESHPSKLAGSMGCKNRYFDFDKLGEVTSIVTENLNKIIDVNYYPVETARRSNMRHRPIGIGVQGLADTFILLGMPFDSQEAQKLNSQIFETIYYHALKSSSELSAKDGCYDTYVGSPVSKGIFQPDMWEVTPSNRWDWSALRQMVAKNGVRNSLLVAPMPTASTSQILGNNECFEPYTSNIYSRRVLSGEFVVVNKHLLHDLTDTGLWNPDLKNKIIYHNGSVQNISEITDELKAIYKTVWEIKQRAIVDMAADRGCYIDQSQSLNIHMDQPNFGKLTSLHFYSWSKGLKTGMYYLRSRAAADAIKFTVDATSAKDKPKLQTEDMDAKLAQMVCSLENKDECLACGS